MAASKTDPAQAPVGCACLRHWLNSLACCSNAALSPVGSTNVAPSQIATPRRLFARSMWWATVKVTLTASVDQPGKYTGSVTIASRAAALSDSRSCGA